MVCRAVDLCVGWASVTAAVCDVCDVCDVSDVRYVCACVQPPLPVAPLSRALTRQRSQVSIRLKEQWVRLEDKTGGSHALDAGVLRVPHGL